jgi:hypothetical protein
MPEEIEIKPPVEMKEKPAGLEEAIEQRAKELEETKK